MSKTKEGIFSINLEILLCSTDYITTKTDKYAIFETVVISILLLKNLSLRMPLKDSRIW